MEKFKQANQKNAARQAKKLTAFRLAGAALGAGGGYMLEKSPQAAALGAGIGLALTYTLERLMIRVGQRLIYQFVDK